MNNYKLNKTEWKKFFDTASKVFSGASADIEISSLDLGALKEGEGLGLEGLSYDDQNDILYVHTTLLDHQIHGPTELFVTYDGIRLHAIGVHDSEGQLQIISFKDPLRLSAPDQAAI